VLLQQNVRDDVAEFNDEFLLFDLDSESAGVFPVVVEKSEEGIGFRSVFICVQSPEPQNRIGKGRRQF
jgi:hypothetical protein